METADARHRELHEQIAALGPVAGQMARMEILLEQLTAQLEKVEKQAASAEAQAREAKETAGKSRKDTLIAVMGFAAPVTVAIIGGVVTLIIGGGG
jgi:hypothetical protein